MGKLGSLLQELKKGSTRKPPEKKFRPLHLLLVLLFVGAISGGYILVNILEKLKTKVYNKTPVSVARKTTSQRAPAVTPENHQIPLTPESPSKKAQPAVKKEPEHPSKPPVKSPERPVKKQTIQKRELKPVLCRAPKKTLSEKGPSELTLTSPPSSENPFVLREKGLRQNLLLNAEEARHKGNIGEAIYFYKEYLKGGADPDVLNNLGVLYLIQSQYEEAERTFREALKIKPDPIYEFNYVLTLMRLNKKKEACLRLKKAFFPDPLKHNFEELLKECRSE
jgi:hypothetical protein